MEPAPIVLFTYNRPLHTHRTITALKRNVLAGQSRLVIYSDGPKTAQDVANVDHVRRYIARTQGFASVEIVERHENLGLANSVIAGITEVVNRYGRVIVLEDDLVSSPFFLQYMNEALALYQKEEKVISIHGYMYPIAEKLPETFFLRGADCWGWSTWKRGWDLFEKDGHKLMAEVKRTGAVKRFDYDGACRYMRMLKEQVAGRTSSWAIRWYASTFLHNRLSLYPGASLIQHIGADGAGTHVGVCHKFDVDLADRPIPVKPIPLAEDLETRGILVDYWWSVKTPWVTAIANRIKKRLRRAS